MAAKRDRASFPKPRLTDGNGKARPDTKNDAPRALQALAMSQVPRDTKGPAMRGAFARGWADAVRERKANENPYQRGGSGFHHGMAGVYAAGWMAGRRVLVVVKDDAASEGMSEAAYARCVELHKRVLAVLAGEIVSPRLAVKRAKRARA